MVKIEIPLPNSFNIVDYDTMPLKKLKKSIKRNMILFFILTTLFFLVGGISTLIVYSLDPVFAVALVTIIFGLVSVFLYFLYIYGKIILFLRVLSGEGGEVRDTKEKTIEGEVVDGKIKQPETIYEKIY